MLNELTILHLSDLHFSWDGAPSEYPPLHRNMLLDIEEQAKYFTYPVIIVVTGDLVNKGCYSKSVTGAIKSFFTKLKNILQDKFGDIFLYQVTMIRLEPPFRKTLHHSFEMNLSRWLMHMRLY